jgi:hypothetical protein
MERTRCYGVYERMGRDEWVYPWGEPVPGARDLTVGDVLRLGLADDGSDQSRTHLREGLKGDTLVDGREPEDLDLTAEDATGEVVGMDAPELHVRAMLTISDIADMVGVEPDTIAAYRYRGYLPEPQAVIGRTPVWSRPVIRHWIQTRPGNGWRTDIYGSREEYAERTAFVRQARRQRMRRPVG